MQDNIMQGNLNGFETNLKNLDTRCKAMAKYISIYFDVFHQKLVGSGWLQATSETKVVL